MQLAEIKKRLVVELKADKKKAGLVAVLTIVAIFMGIRLAVSQGGKNGSSPSEASASVSDLPSGGWGTVPYALGEGSVAGQSAEALRRTKYIKNIDRRIVRDIFEPNQAFFPLQDQQKSTPKLQNVAPVGNPVNERAAHENVIAEQAASLSLQTIIVGSVPTAIINGRVLRVGDWINGFEIVEITAQSCVVCKEKVQVRLDMHK